MNILLLADRFPFPLTNGQNLRLYNLLRCLVARHSIDMVCYGEDGDSSEVTDRLRRVETFICPPQKLSRGWCRMIDSLSVDKLQVFSEEVRRHVEQAIAERDYDLVWVVGWGLAPIVPRHCRLPVLVDLIDDGVLEYWREFRVARGIRESVRMFKRLLLIYLFERKYFGSADHCVVVSEIDAVWFSKVCPGTEVSVVHNGVDTAYYQPLGGDQRANQLVFEGMISFSPNTDGILYFCHEVLPLIHARRPDMELLVVGKSPPDEIQALAEDPRIRVTGFVEDVRPYVDQSAIFVCPLRKGCGIKNKMLQAWSMAKATVATPVSLGGLKAEEGENVLIGRDAAEIASAVLRLAEDRPMRERLGGNARRTVIDNYSWESKATVLEGIFGDMTEQGKVPGNA